MPGRRDAHQHPPSRTPPTTGAGVAGARPCAACDNRSHVRRGIDGIRHLTADRDQGNSGSGKSTIAHELRRRCGRSWALVEQDYLRRIVLWEHDKPGGLAPALIAHTVRFALDNGFDVILEGILHTARYRDVVASLWRAHR